MSNPVITVENLSKSYVLKHQQVERYTALRDVIAYKAKNILKFKSDSGHSKSEEFWALKNVSFEVNEGDRIGIIGRNGAGKSTLLKILSRIVSPTSGRITIEGRVASLLEVGTGFHPELSGRENIYLNGSILGMSKSEIRSKFDEIVAFSEVERFLDTPVKRYSSGMYVRLAFAVAAHLDPEVLIVDEVLAVGDAEFQRKCIGKMKDVSSSGRTILFVSHNMQMIQKLCNKGILLQKGNILQSGDIDSTVQKYMDTSEENNAVYEIPLPIDHEMLPGYVTKVQVEDSEEKLISEVPIGEPWQIRLFITVTKSSTNFVVGLGLCTILDMALQTTWTLPQSINPGNYEVVFHNDTIIYTEGQYKLIVGLTSEKRSIQYIDGAGFITISAVTRLTESEGIVNTQSGLLINQMKTVITKVG